MTAPSSVLSPAAAREWLRTNVPLDDFQDRRVLCIVPDATRTAPLPLLFGELYDRLQPVTRQLDVLVALGTHPPMAQPQIRRMLGLSGEPHGGRFSALGLFNHEWDRSDRLLPLGTLSRTETQEISQGRLAEEVPVSINARITDYDLLLVLGPVFPHEVVGFSGGNKYFFPGISGPELLHFFHWLGALMTNRGIIGRKETPVRRIVDRAAEMIPVERRCLAFVVSGNGTLHGMAYGSPEQAWDSAADLSSEVHITRVPRPFQQVISCAPAMYDELWVAGKCMYKLEPVVADGGELVIYAPHLKQISATHGRKIEQIGYHVRDYFTKQWDRFQDVPRGVLAHSTHVRGQGTYEDGLEKPRIQVTLASQIPRETCQRINLGYRDPETLNPEALTGREDEGILVVPHAGEQLYRLEQE